MCTQDGSRPHGATKSLQPRQACPRQRLSHGTAPSGSTPLRHAACADATTTAHRLHLDALDSRGDCKASASQAALHRIRSSPRAPARCGHDGLIVIVCSNPNDLEKKSSLRIRPQCSQRHSRVSAALQAFERVTDVVCIWWLHGMAANHYAASACICNLRRTGQGRDAALTELTCANIYSVRVAYYLPVCCMPAAAGAHALGPHTALAASMDCNLAHLLAMIYFCCGLNTTLPCNHMMRVYDPYTMQGRRSEGCQTAGSAGRLSSGSGRYDVSTTESVCNSAAVLVPDQAGLNTLRRLAM